MHFAVGKERVNHCRSPLHSLLPAGSSLYPRRLCQQCGHTRGVDGPQQRGEDDLWHDPEKLDRGPRQDGLLQRGPRHQGGSPGLVPRLLRIKTGRTWRQVSREAWRQRLGATLGDLAPSSDRKIYSRRFLTTGQHVCNVSSCNFSSLVSILTLDFNIVFDNLYSFSS